MKHNLLSTLIDENQPNCFIDSELVYTIKEIINKLNPVDKTIFLLYLEYNSYQKVADLLKVSQSTIYLDIKRIRCKIQKYLKTYC